MRIFATLFLAACCLCGFTCAPRHHDPAPISQPAKPPTPLQQAKATEDHTLRAALAWLVVPALAGLAVSAALMYLLQGSRIAIAAMIGSAALLTVSLLTRELLFTHALMYMVYGMCSIAVLALVYVFWEHRYVFKHLQAGKDICELKPRLQKIATRMLEKSKTPLQ